MPPATESSQSPTVLITGASSGLGRAFFEHYSKHCRVVAIDKQPWTDADGNQHDLLLNPPHAPNSVYARLDVTLPAESLRSALRAHIGAATPVLLVVHCAGVRGLVPHVPIAASSDVAAAETLEAMDAATMLRTYEINVVGTFNVLTAVLPNLVLARGAKVVIMSSRMGSVSANVAGGGYAYRASKAALNAVVKSLSLDVPDVFFALVHPGRVETGLVCVKEDGAISPEESLRDLLPLIDEFGTTGRFKTACYLDRFGETIKW